MKLFTSLAPPLRLERRTRIIEKWGNNKVDGATCIFPIFEKGLTPEGKVINTANDTDNRLAHERHYRNNGNK